MEEKKEISLEIRPEVAKGTYSNLAIITHSHSELSSTSRQSFPACLSRTSATAS